MLGDSINIDNLCHPVVLKKIIGKTSKNCYFGVQLVQKRGQHEPHLKQKSIFFSEITKLDHQ